MIKNSFFVILFVSFFIPSCVRTTEDLLLEDKTEFTFPQDFNFLNSKTIRVQWVNNQVQETGLVEIYLNETEPIHLGTFSSINGLHSFRVPNISKELRLVFKNGTSEKTAIYSIAEKDLVYWELPLLVENNSSGRLADENGCRDRLYAVENSFGGFWDIDLSGENYDELQLPNLQGGGSIACALDQANNQMYYNVNKTLYTYDIGAETFNVVHTGNPFGGSYPRLAFKGDKLYMSNGSKLYIVDAITNVVERYYNIQGFINNNGGGDIDFTSDGALYLSCFSGLYKFTSFDDNNGTAQIERISAENFPYKLTSMAIDRQDRIFVGTNDGSSRLIEMNKVDGSFQIVKTFNHKINDLTAWKCPAEDLAQVDTDGDGIIDELDDYPEDPVAAFDVFTPSEIGYGTLAFEDMWPANGDYDFNDMVINYRFTNVMNSSNESVRLEIELKLMAAGATFENGFGIALPVQKSMIESVQGMQLTENIVTLDEKGLEQGQSGTVLIPFDNALAQFGGLSLINTIPSRGVTDPVTIKMTVNFIQPIDGSQLEGAPYNPFIFIGGDRGREVHLMNRLPTDLVDPTYFGTIEDNSDEASGRYYQNSENVPWGIDMIHNFRFPVEKTRIDKAYNYFLPWGKTMGATYKDWYKDNNGYRNTSKIVFIY